MNETSFHQSNNLYPDASISKKLQDAADNAVWKAEIEINKKAETASLGKDAKLVGESQQLSVEKENKNNSYNDFRLLSEAQKILKHANIKNRSGTNNHRTRNCHACRSFQAETIKLKLSTNENNSKAALSGLQTCGSVWSCPVCARRIKIERAKEIKKAIEWADKNKHTPIMLTVTAAHSYNMRLAEFKKKFKIAWRKFGQSSVWRRLRKMLGITDTIKATEVTRTYENGWHYHYHGLLFVLNSVLMQLDDKELETWKEDVGAQWIKCLEKAGLTGEMPYACNVVSHEGVGAEYLTKLGLEDEANVAYELTSGSNKHTSRNIWRILKDAKLGIKEDAMLYIEFVEAMQGEFFIFWSKGFKKKVGADDISDEEIASQEEEKPQFEEFMTISDDKYSYVRKTYAQADLLQVAATTRDKAKVDEFLLNLQNSYTQKDRKFDILRLEKQYLSLKTQCLEHAIYLKKNSSSKETKKRLEFLIKRRDGVKNTLFELQKNSDLIPF